MSHALDSRSLLADRVLHPGWRRHTDRRRRPALVLRRHRRSGRVLPCQGDAGVPTVDRTCSNSPSPRRPSCRDAIHLYNLGWSLARVGDHLGVNHTTVLNKLHERGIPTRDTHGRSRVEAGGAR